MNRHVTAFLCMMLFVAMPAHASSPRLRMLRSVSAPTQLVPGAITSNWDSAWPTCESTSTCPPDQGSSFGGLKAPAHWDQPAFAMVTGTIPLCLSARALVTSANFATAPYGFGVISMAVNGGVPYTGIAYTTSSPSGLNEACTTFDTTQVGDGVFAVRAQLLPLDGTPVEMDQPDTVASPAGGDETLYLVANNGGTFNGPTYQVYTDPASSNTSAGCGTTRALACKYPCDALATLASAHGGDASFGTIFANSFTYTDAVLGLTPVTPTINGCGTSTASANGWVSFTPDTGAGATQASVILQSVNNNGFNTQKIRLYNITYQRIAATGLNSGFNTNTTHGQVFLDHVIYTGPSTYDTFSGGPTAVGNRWGRQFTDASDYSFTGMGCANQYFFRNTNIHDVGNHAVDACITTLNVNIDHLDTNYYDTPFGSQTAVLNVTAGDTVLSVSSAAPFVPGVGLWGASIFCVDTGHTGFIYGTSGNAGGTITAADPIANTITISTATHTLTQSCTRASIATGAHPDIWIFSGAYTDMIADGLRTDGVLNGSYGTVTSHGAPWMDDNNNQSRFWLGDSNDIVANGQTGFEIGSVSGASFYNDFIMSNTNFATTSFWTYNVAAGHITNAEMIQNNCPTGHGIGGSVWTFLGTGTC